MNFNSVLAKIKQVVDNLNKRGIVLLWIRDPKTQESSVSLTLLVVSFVIVAGGLIGKWTKLLSADTSDTFQLLYATAALYFSRKFTNSGKDNKLE